MGSFIRFGDAHRRRRNCECIDCVADRADLPVHRWDAAVAARSVAVSPSPAQIEDGRGGAAGYGQGTGENLDCSSIVSAGGNMRKGISWYFRMISSYYVPYQGPFYGRMNHPVVGSVPSHNRPANGELGRDDVAHQTGRQNPCGGRWDASRQTRSTHKADVPSGDPAPAGPMFANRRGWESRAGGQPHKATSSSKTQTFGSSLSQDRTDLRF